MMRAMGEFVSLDVANGVGTIRLDRPKMNALNRQVQEELREAAIAAATADEVRAVIVYGGERVFAAGADIKAMVGLDHTHMVAWGRELTDSFTRVATLPKPVIAAITGYALGGGYELALCADFRVLGAGAKIGQPEILLGVIPGAGGTQRLPRLVGPARAKDIIFSGRFVAADEALRIGLVERVYPAAELPGAARALARQIAGQAPLAVAAIKQAIERGQDMALADACMYEAALFGNVAATADAKEGTGAFLEKRMPTWTGG